VNDGLKQRIIGALVLVALAAIFFPLLLNISEERQIDTQTRIPPRPDIQTVEIAEPVRPENIEPAPLPADMFQFGVDKPEQGEPLAAEKSGLNAEGVPRAWLVQVGGFRERKKADAIVNDLKADGYKAFMRAGPSTAGQLYRVFVGPKIEKQRALNQKAAIDKKYQVNSIVVRFEP